MVNKGELMLEPDVDMINEMAFERIVDDLDDEVEALNEETMQEIAEFALDHSLHLDDDLDEILAGVAEARFENGPWD
jgi:hypothetical protein